MLLVKPDGCLGQAKFSISLCIDAGVSQELVFQPLLRLHTLPAWSYLILEIQFPPLSPASFCLPHSRLNIQLPSGHLYLEVYLSMRPTWEKQTNPPFSHKTWLSILSYPGGFKIGPQIIWHSSDQKMKSLSPSLKPGYAFVTALINRMQQKWGCVESEARLERASFWWFLFLGHPLWSPKVPCKKLSSPEAAMLDRPQGKIRKSERPEELQLFESLPGS